MERTKWPAITGLVVGTALLCQTAPTTFAFDKPIHGSIVVLASCAASIICTARLLPRDGQQYEAIPLSGIGEPHASCDPLLNPEHVRYPSSLRKLRLFARVLIAAVCLRAGVVRQVLANTQCTKPSWAPLLPFLLACLDFVTIRRSEGRTMLADGFESSVHQSAGGSIGRAPYRYVVATALLGFSSMLAMTTTSAPASTVICAATLPDHWVVPGVQRLGTLLDLVSICCVGQLLHQHGGRGARRTRLKFMTVGYSLLFSAVLLFVIGTVYESVKEQEREWILTIPSWYFWSVVRLDLLLCFLCICTLLCITHIGTMSTAAIATFIATTTTTTSYAWNHARPFPPNSTALSFVAICLVILGFAMYFHVDSASVHTSSDAKSTTSVGQHLRAFIRVPRWFYVFLLALFFVRTGLWVSHTASIIYHPIDLLIFDASHRHEAYLNQTLNSTTLPEAARNYRERYLRHPPPGFDAWYAYATARNAVIIDDYDSIHRDIAPFWALDPEVIRERTFQLISDEWNEVAGVSIRSKQVTIMPNVPGTHRWMLEGLKVMISKFAKHIPDMDLAFNLNDECRVAVPYEDIEPMRAIGVEVSMPASRSANEFSVGREEQWQAVLEEAPFETTDPEHSPLRELSGQRTFYDFGNVGCPPSSPARTQHVWNAHDLCIDCTYPQSLGAFLANWSLAADVCHQPDLANLHGFYLSPAAFKASHQLYPIFSQSKISGFNDILYPSAWNYLDKAKYDPSSELSHPPFLERNSTLFWRGTTSEGLSHMGQWKGMTRQRFVHMANNIHGSEAPQSLLLPEGALSVVHHAVIRDRKAHRLSYHSVGLKDLSRLLSTDVHVVDHIARCGSGDCDNQANEFAPRVPPSDFRSHWKYKYLLDLDGAGFSGRFLPFLQSHSLPFKAGLFREWWDDRVTAWLHFVPLDVRGQGFWGTLAYFAGINGTLYGHQVAVKAHDREGERIAARGRQWAEQVLRKEDMEIYFFRLLLEWGRLTDDNRDEIGYDVV